GVITSAQAGSVIPMTSTPNATLRAVRMGMLLSQDDFARALRAAGARTGTPNDASKRLVQRWESGQITAPRAAYARALEAVTRLPIEPLAFGTIMVSIDGDRLHPDRLEPSRAGATVAQPATAGGYTGIWLSRYEYYSSGRDATFTAQHYVVLLQ